MQLTKMVLSQAFVVSKNLFIVPGFRGTLLKNEIFQKYKSTIFRIISLYIP